MSDNTEDPDDQINWDKLGAELGPMVVMIIKPTWEEANNSIEAPKRHVCPCCTNLLPPGITVAETLLELHYRTDPRHINGFFVAKANRETGESMKQVLAAKLADDMVRCGMGLVFRAIYEEWSQARINQEVY